MNRLLPRPPVGIRFADYVFSNPASLDRFSLPPRSAGLYVILMPDSTCGPWHLQPLFFGEFGPDHQLHMTQAQQMCCLKVAGGRTLYFSLYAVPQPSAWPMSEIKKELIARYRPLSNLESIDRTADVVQRLE